MTDDIGKLDLPDRGADVRDRVKYLIKLSRMTQAEFARRIDIDPGALSRILSGRSPVSRAFLNRLVVNFGVSLRWLADGSDVPFPKDSTATHKADKPVGAPIYDVKAAAGTISLERIFTDEYISGRLLMPGVDPQLPIISVEGNSMSPRIPSGSYISIKPTDPDTIMWGETYVVVTAKYRVVKVLRRNQNPDLITLHSENPQYDDFEIPKKDIEGLYQVMRIINVI